MQWDNSENAGFTEGTPWKRVNDNYREINVAAQLEDPNSVLNHFRKMTKLRSSHLSLIYGKYDLVQQEHEHIYAFTRSWEDERLLVLLNFSEEDASIDLGEEMKTDTVLINNYQSVKTQDNVVDLQPYQAVIISLK